MNGLLDVQFLLFHEFDHLYLCFEFIFSSTCLNPSMSFCLFLSLVIMEQILNPSLLFRMSLKKSFFIFNMCLNKLQATKCVVLHDFPIATFLK